MKKRIKKVIAIILTVATVMTMFITPTFAASITSGAKGSDYTARRSLAKKLDEVFAGNVEIYSDAKCTKRITSTLGTSYLTYSNLGYAGSASHHSYRGSTCWLYLNGVYYHLFSEVKKIAIS